MPKKRISGPFVRDPAYDEQADVRKRVEEVKKISSCMMAKIHQFSDDIMQCLCMFSMIDCFAQEWAGYPRYRSATAFCDFVLQFQNQYDYLKKVEPVTLYYRVENIIEKQPLFPGMEPVPVVDINDLRIGVPFSKVLDSKFSKTLVSYIQQNCNADEYKKLIKEHSVISLLYQMRNKITHELSGLGSENRWEKEEGKSEPYYRSMGRMYVSDGNIVSDDVYELVFPCECYCNS